MTITVGMIALNAMPWIKYALECCYNFADKIIIVEGAVPSAVFMCNPDGSSIDNTNEFLKNIHDPENKIEVIHGKWLNKTQMSNAYFEKAEPGYVWQIDSDECYYPSEMELILNYVIDNNIAIANTPVIQFWKNTNTILYGGVFDTFAPRIFKKRKGDVLVDHRPPKILFMEKPIGKRLITLRDQTHSKPGYLLDNNLCMYHYSWIGDQKVKQKAQFFEALRPDHPHYGKHYSWWYPNVWKAWDEMPEVEKMYGLHPSGSGKTKEFKGNHPEPIRKAIARGEI